MNRIIFFFWNQKEKRLRVLWRLIFHGLVMFFFIFVIASLLAVINSFFRDSFLSFLGQEYEEFLMLFLGLLVTFLATLLSMLWAGKKLDKRNFADYGLNFGKNSFYDFIFGFLLGAGLISIIFLLQYSLSWVEIKDTFVSIRPGSPFWLDILLPFIFFVLVGIEEELLSRGYHLLNLGETLGRMKFPGRKGGLILAVLISSFLFGFLHINNPSINLLGIINISLAGVLMALGFIFTGSLAFPIGFHISWNFFQGNIFGFPVSGIKDLPLTLISIEQKGPDLWTGGVFGPEGGFFSTIILVLGILLLLLWVKMRYRELNNKLKYRDEIKKAETELKR
ncbi:MAG TPA: type II CAAX endopeptidase family protein [Halanaerobiales bacterium]|nr:type II CAAX endopeptidase family protein [Halanaerobiales bacterium]